MRTRLRNLGVFLLVLLLTLGIATAGFAAPKIRVGWFLVPGLHDYDPDTGKVSGFEYDYLKAIAQYTGWEYEFVVEPVEDCFADLQKGNLDLIGNVAKNSEREKLFLYSIYDGGRASPRLVTQATNKKYAFEDFAGFNGMKIGVVRGSYFEHILPSYASAHHFNYQLERFKARAEMDKALKTGQIDAALISGMRTVQDTRVLAQLPAEAVYFICAPEKPWIREQLDHSLALIRYFDKAFDERVYAKYFSENFFTSVAFSVDEQKYMAQLAQEDKAINVLYDPAWQPLEAKDPKTGAYVGIGRDIYDLLARRTGVKFNFLTADSFKNTVEQYGNHVDLYSLISYDFMWADELDISLTQPILEAQIFKVYRHDGPEQEVALPDGYYLTKVVQERLAKSGLRPVYKLYTGTSDCLDAVRNGDADSTYITSLELNYFLDKIQLEHLSIQGLEGFSISYAIGVSKKADPRLLTLISRAVTGISSSEINQIVIARAQQRLQPSLLDRVYANPLRYVGLAVLGMLILGLVVFFYLSNRYNRRQRFILQASNRAKNEFLSRVSHDIRTPINAIISMTHFAKEDLADKDKVKAELDKIDTSSRYLLFLLNDVLDISKAESGKIELHPEPYAFAEYIQGLSTIFKPLCAKNGQNFVLDMGTCAPGKGVIVDRVRFDQVVMNLLANAVKYTPAGGTITYLSESRVLADGRLDCGFRIIDTGIGMSKEFQKVMFEPFSQEHGNPRRGRVMEGTGLGLSIVKKIVDLMGGTITVASELGKGTQIAVHFILEQATKEQLARLAEEKQKKMTFSSGLKLTGRVLLAEDNVINTEIALRLLQRLGLEVDATKNGQEALNLFEASQPGFYQAVLMDIQMPLMNGYDAAKQLRALDRPDAATIPIIAMTADVFDDAVQACFKCGMNEHVPKPINPQNLGAVLAKYLLKGD